MMKQVVLGLSLATTLAACGPATAGKKTPPPANPLDTYHPIVASDAQNGNNNDSTSLSSGTTTTTTTGNNVAAPTDTKAFALSSAAGKTFESNCYRFGTTGDYSKKYWGFTADTMTSLLLKYSDENCTVISKNTDGSAKAWSTWVIGSLTTKALSSNWIAVSGACTKGCSQPYSTAFRFAGTTLQEGSKVADKDLYNTDEGRYVNNTPTKTALDLEALAASLSGTASTTPTTPAVPAVAPTGLDQIASLAGQSWSTCYASNNKEGTATVQRGFKRTLTFIKGATAAADAYRSDLVKYSNIDCTGDIVLPASASRTYSSLVVKTAATAGWIEVDAQACADSCKGVNTLLALPTATEGLKEAGEKTTAPGTFYTDTPRAYTLDQ